MDRKEGIYAVLSASVAVVAVFLSATILLSGQPAEPKVSTVVIPFGTNEPYNPKVNETHLDPQSITVVVGENNTVRWVNKSVSKQWIVPQTMDDLAFYLIAPRGGAIMSDGPITNLVPDDDGSFEFTFTKPGVYPYTIGNQGGIVKVLPADGQIIIPARVVDKPLYTIQVPYVARMAVNDGKIYATTGNYLYIIDSNTNTVQANLTSYGSFRMAIDSATDKIYMINDETGDLYTRDGETGKVIHSMNIGRPGAEISPIDIEVDGNSRIYINYENATARNSGILIFDENTYKELRNLVSADPQGDWYQMAVSPKDGIMYVTGRSGFNQTVTVIDSNVRDVIIGTIEIETGGHDIAVNPVTRMAYLTTSSRDQRQAGSTSLKVIEGATSGTPVVVAADMVIDAGINAANSFDSVPSIAIDQKNNIVYVTNYLQRSVSAVDGSANKVIDRIELDGNPTGVAVDPDTGRVYVSEQQAILVFDGRSEARP